MDLISYNIYYLKVELEPAIKQVITLSVSKPIRPLLYTIITVIIEGISPRPVLIAAHVVFSPDKARLH